MISVHVITTSKQNKIIIYPISLDEQFLRTMFLFNNQYSNDRIKSSHKAYILYFTKVLSSPIICVIVFSKCEQPYMVSYSKMYRLWIFLNYKSLFYSFKFLYVLFYVSIIINQINKKYLNDSIKAYILFFLRRFCQVQYFTLLCFQNVNSIIR